MKDLLDNVKNVLTQIIQTLRDQLKKLSTVGEILDFLSLSIKLLFIENSSTNSITLLINIFEILPETWESDPVKVSKFLCSRMFLKTRLKNVLHWEWSQNNFFHIRRKN